MSRKLDETVGDYDIYETESGFYFENRYIGEEDAVMVHIVADEVIDYEGKYSLPLLIIDFLEVRGIEACN